MSRHSRILSVGSVLMLASPLHAATWTVGHSGNEDFSTFRSACEAASSGDSILISPGYYDETDGFDWITLVSKPLSFIGLGATPDDTCLRLLLWLRGCDGTLLENLCVRDSGNWHPVAIQGGRTVVRQCSFRNNAGGAAVSSPAVHSEILVEDCVFSDNGTPDIGGYGGALVGSPLTVRRSVFVGNQTGGFGGAIYTGGVGLIEDCVFFRNEAPHGAAISISDAVQVRGCTFLANRVTSQDGGAILCDWGGLYEPIRNCIIAGTENGYGVECPGGCWLICCDLWDNDLGDHWGDWYCDATAMNGNFSADPLFCDPLTGDVGLLEGSPCLPGNHGGMDCDLIGARGLGCGIVQAREITWGRVKTLFR